MPQVFKVCGYVVFMWFAESNPLEPIHVHVCKGIPAENATKIWITKARKALLCHNKSKIPVHKLHIIIKLIEANVHEIVEKWLDYFGKISFYC